MSSRWSYEWRVYFQCVHMTDAVCGFVLVITSISLRGVWSDLRIANVEMRAPYPNTIYHIIFYFKQQGCI